MAYYRDMPLVTGSSPQLWFLDPDMAYAFPTDGGLTMLACVPHKDRIPEFKADPEAAMARMFERVPEGPVLDPSKRVFEGPRQARRPERTAPPRRRRVCADRRRGHGLRPALGGGNRLGPAIGGVAGRGGRPGPRRGEGAGRRAEALRRRHRKALAGHDRACSDYSNGHRFRAGERSFFRAAARDDELARRFALFGERWIKPTELLTPSTMGLMIRANLSRTAKPLGLKVPAQETG